MDRTSVRTFPLQGLTACIRPGGEEVLSPGRRVTDVCVSIAHCKKVVFTFLPFYLFTFLNIIQLHSVTIFSTGPFSISEWEGHFLLIVFFGGY